MKKIVLILIILASLWPAYAGAINLEDGNDKYWHAGFGASCNLIWTGIFSAGDPDESDQFVVKHPKWGAFILCNGIGLLKEFAWDDRPDWKDIAANNVGIIGGSVVILEW